MFQYVCCSGSGNIIALDILRAQDSFSALMMDIKLACGVNKDFDSFVTNLESNIGSATGNSGTEAQRSARFLADHMALALQGSIMIRYGDSKVCECDVLNAVFSVIFSPVFRLLLHLLPLG